MRLFSCQACGQRLHFENTVCLNCGRQLGYLPAHGTLSAVEPEGAAWRAHAAPGLYRFCQNWERSACNWMLPADADGPLCRACRHNRTIPDLSDPAAHALWQKVEAAKRRLIYALLRLRLPAPDAASDDPLPLVFDFPADRPGETAMTGHASGLITVALAEADDSAREARRRAMGEEYRTLLGHFRHEIGHYYWDRLVRDGPELGPFRDLFGDERADYAAALARHHAEGPPPDWATRHVSAYAAAHPWEDWAETVAHYLHIVDGLEMAGAFGIEVEGEGVDFDPYRATEMAPLMAAWQPLSMAANGLNRTMGQPDLYPFAPRAGALEKIGFVQRVLQGAGRG